jgi:ribosomal protein L37AE/L43A
MKEIDGLQPVKNNERGSSLVDVIEVVLDKGLVINADIVVSVAGVELLGIKIRAALASFETAARYGMEFPSGTDISTSAWEEAQQEKEICPQCGKKVSKEVLLKKMCPWCGWKSAIVSQDEDIWLEPEIIREIEYRN